MPLFIDFMPKNPLNIIYINFTLRYQLSAAGTRFFAKNSPKVHYYQRKG